MGRGAPRTRRPPCRLDALRSHPRSTTFHYVPLRRRGSQRVTRRADASRCNAGCYESALYGKGRHTGAADGLVPGGYDALRQSPRRAHSHVSSPPRGVHRAPTAGERGPRVSPGVASRSGVGARVGRSASAAHFIVAGIVPNCQDRTRPMLCRINWESSGRSRRREKVEATGVR